MKELFFEYYPLDKHELAQMWDTGIFVPDANVLLNMYRYSPLTRDELTAVLEALSDRLWLPYQAALEYQRNRPKVIIDHVQSFGPAQSALAEAEYLLRLDTDCPLVGLERVREVESLFEQIRGEIEARRRHYEHLLDSDITRDRIDKLFIGKVGPSYSAERLEEIYEYGEHRYEQKIPPGYADASTKFDNTKYGDLVIWFEILDHAEREQRPVVFITEDLKEDWWQRSKGVRLGPRPELRRELCERVDGPLLMYTTKTFLETAADYLNRKVEASVYTEVLEIEELFEGADPQEEESAARELAKGEESIADERPAA